MFLAHRLARPVALALAVPMIGAPLMIASPAAAQKPASELAKVEAHLAAAQSMTASFLQTDGRGRQMKGMITLKRPGKVRFDYGTGANMLLVGNGKTLDFVDYSVGQVSRWPIAKSPLAVLLDDKPNLSRIARVVPSNDPRILVIRARDARRPEFGTLILAFTRGGGPGGLMLQGWTAIDAQNKKTTVKLDGQRYNIAVPESSFTYAAPRKKG